MASKTHNSKKLPVESLEAFDEDSFLSELGQEGKNLGKGLLDQLFGSLETTTLHPQSGDLMPGQELKLSKHKPTHDLDARPAEKARRMDIAPAMDYHREIATVEKRASAQETAEMKQAIQQIQIELQRLVSSSSMLQLEFGQVSMGQAPTTPGKYHVNFFQWVLTVIRQARMKVEDAGAWQSSMKGKKNKQGFWGRAKNEGTTFSQHHDRSVATQTG